MENRIYDNEFEEFLKNQANQHRIYPSDQVWRNIQGEVHGYRKWPALTIISVLIIAALVVGTVAVKPHTEIAKATTENNSPLAITTETNIPENDPVSANANTKTYSSHLSVDNISRQTIASATQKVHSDEAGEWLIIPESKVVSGSSVADNTAKNVPSGHVVSTAQNIPDENVNKNVTVVATAIQNTLAKSLPDARDIFSSTTDFLNNNDYHFTEASYKSANYFYSRDNRPAQLNLDFNGNIARSISNSALSRITNSSSRFDFQFYVTPSISYRRLVDDAKGTLSKSYITALPFASNYVVDLNHAIQHRPGAGYEIGASLGYNITKKFELRTGLQFNMRQYNIDAFVHSAEPTAVALSANNADLVYNTVSAFRNIEGSKPIELKNRYYEIALPIGIDWRPINGRFAWGIAASVQPTYTFDKEPFIISSNYKNYADGSQLMRNWNINGNVETYLGYNTGKYRWQLGPQIRYQLMPTMGNAFPIREFPVDFGIKLGLTRSLK